MGTILHFAETSVDFLEVGELWPQEFGSFAEHAGAQACVANALRAGTLLLLRDEDSQGLVAAAAVDLETYSPNMFVPFVLVRSGLSNELATRKQLNSQILRLAMLRGVPRLMFHITKNEQYNKIIEELNKSLTESGSRIQLDVSGEIDDLYGDGRTISTVSLFIKQDERPDLMGNVVKASNEFYKTVIRHGKKEAISIIVGASLSADSSGGTGSSGGTIARMAGGTTGGFGSMQAACCSGCNEDNKNDKTGKDGKEGGKDKDVGKEGKDSKDGGDKGSSKDGIERMSKLTPEKGAVDASGILTTYAQLGIQQFDRSDSDFPFVPMA